MTPSEASTLFTGAHLRLVKKDHWEYAERTTSRGAVLIVPITAAGELVFVEQWRLPLDANVIEFPAGLAGDEPALAHEALFDAARRELLEETGFEAAEWLELPTCPTSSGLSSETVTFFLARGARRVAKGGGDAHEQITVHVVPRRGVVAWLAEHEAAGKLVATVVYAGLYFADEWAFNGIESVANHPV